MKKGKKTFKSLPVCKLCTEEDYAHLLRDKFHLITPRDQICTTMLALASSCMRNAQYLTLFTALNLQSPRLS